MRTLKFYALAVLLTYALAHASYGQNTMAVVDYMKVEPSKVSQYLELEKKWKTIHEARIKNGVITNWGLYEVMFTGENDPYNYVTVTWYKGMEKFDDSLPQNAYEEAYPQLASSEGLQSFMRETLDARSLVASNAFHLLTQAETDPASPPKYFAINSMRVKPKKAQHYIQMEKEIYKPMHEEAIKAKNRAGWSVWMKWPGNFEDFQYGTVDAYSSFEQMSPGSFEDIFKAVHPDKNIDEVVKKTLETRTIARTELWKLIDMVSPPSTALASE